MFNSEVHLLHTILKQNEIIHQINQVRPTYSSFSQVFFIHMSVIFAVTLTQHDHDLDSPFHQLESESHSQNLDEPIILLRGDQAAKLKNAFSVPNRNLYVRLHDQQHPSSPKVR